MSLQLDIFFLKIWAVIKLQIIQVSRRFYVSQGVQSLFVLV